MTHTDVILMGGYEKVKADLFNQFRKLVAEFRKNHDPEVETELHYVQKQIVDFEELEIKNNK